MTTEIDVGGVRYVVSIRPGASAEGRSDQMLVSWRRAGDALPPEEVAVQATRTDTGLLLAFPDSGLVVDVAATPTTAGSVLIQLPHVDVSAVTNSRRSSRQDQTGGAHEGQQVVAPMPGRVVKVLVSPGDEVSPGQAVVVIEAMKMENELRAGRRGRVREVLVEPLASVEAGRPLVLIE